MSRALGCATAVPVSALLLLVAFVLAHDRPWSDISGDILAVFVLYWLAALVLTAVLAVVYVVLAARNDRLGGAGKAVWVALILVATPLTTPVYWWAFLRWRPNASSIER